MTDKGNYRSIYSTLTDSDDYLTLSKDARLLLLVIKLCRFNNMANIFICDEGTVVTLSKMTNIPAKKVQSLITGELTDTHWIAFQYPLLWIINGLKYEPSINLNNGKQKTGVENILKSLPKSQLVLNFCDHYNLAYPYESPSIPIRSTETETYTYTETEKETETETEAPKKGKNKSGNVSEHKEIIDYFCELHLEYMKTKYGFNSGKDGQLIKTMLAQFGFERMKLIISAFFESTEAFILKAGKTVPVLKSQSNKLNQRIANPGMESVSARTINNLTSSKSFVEKLSNE